MNAKYLIATITLVIISFNAAAQQQKQPPAYPEKPDSKWTPPANYYTMQPPETKIEVVAVTESELIDESKKTNSANTNTNSSGKQQPVSSKKKPAVRNNKSKNN